MDNHNKIENNNKNIQKSNLLIERKQFLKVLDGNEQALRMLSLDRLKKLEEYYDSVIEKNNKIIEELKKKKYNRKIPYYMGFFFWKKST